jgi:hypothetical protein
VRLRELARAVAGAGKRLANQIVKLNRAMAEDAFVRDLRQLAERVGQAGPPPGPIVEPERAPLEGRGWDRIPARRVPTFVFRGDATWSDLLGPALPDRADLSALPPPVTEAEVIAELRDLAGRNRVDIKSLIGVPWRAA